jgi:hypothetical protein
MYSESGPGRSPVSNNGRSGHPKWTTGTYFYHAEQVWEASPAAVIAAAEAGHDMSRPGSRNRLAAANLPQL